MNVQERYRAAYRHQPVDRVPVALSYYHAGFARKHLTRTGKIKTPSNAASRTSYAMALTPTSTSGAPPVGS